MYSITCRLGSEASQVNPSPNDEATGVESRTTPRRQRVLLVDDDASILEILSAAFSRAGHIVFEAHDGSEALVSAERDAPDLVVLDLVMPRRSGFAVLDRLRERHPTRPAIIVVTANTDPRHRQFAEDHGANAFFSKPFDMDALLETARSLLELD